MADFKLGRIKFKWRGDWSTSTGFLIDDVVKYGGNTYVCIVNHTSQSTSPGFYTDLTAAKWSLQAESLFFKGTYAASTHYKLNDVVKYGARQYRCTTQHTSAATVGGVAILNAANFELYIDATDYKGTYTTSTYYKVNDVVKYGGSLYICTTAHTSSAGASSFNESNFSAYTEGLQFEDSWSSATAYQKGDIVTYGGYAYVASLEIPSGSAAPVASSLDWDLIVPGFKAQGDWISGNQYTYKTGDTVKFGGYAYVCIVDTFNDGSTNVTPINTSFWTKVVEGFTWKGTYSAITTYFKGDTVEYNSSSYVAIAHTILNVTPGTDVTKWQLIAAGDSNAVVTTRGDISYRNASAPARLPIGVVGSVLTSNGLEPVWSNAGSRGSLFVANNGDDTNPGTSLLPFKTIEYALSQASKGDVVTITGITGGTGGISGTYSVTATGGTGTGFAGRIVVDSSTVTATLTITNGGKNYTAGDTLTISNAQLGGTPATNMTFTVESVSVGDIINVAGGVYREQMPLVIPAGVTLKGESLRTTELRPATGSSSTIATVTRTSGGIGGTPGTYLYKHQSSTSGSGQGACITVVKDGSSVPTITVVHGGYNYAVSDTITILGFSLGGGSDLVLTVTALENNNAAYCFLCNDTNNIRWFTFRGFTGIATHTGLGAVITSLDPEGNIASQSPYIQDCTVVSNNACGIKIDGFLHTSATSNKSILANDFTQINSDGIGVWALNGGRGEMVSVFTYYCDKSFYATGGGFIRGLNCSSAYGEEALVAEGELSQNTLAPIFETPVRTRSRGRTIKYNATTFSGGNTPASFVIGQTIVGNTSGATGTIFRINLTGERLHLDPATGAFTQGETITVTTTSGTFTVQIPNTAAGISGNGAKQAGFFVEVESTDGTLTPSGAIKIGDNVKIGNNPNYFIVNGVTNEDAPTQTVQVRLVSEVSTLDAYPDNTAVVFSRKYSALRFTGHDFLDIGTGDFVTTNYPGTPSQPADQADEVEFSDGGRVYWTSTDQGGDFRVGDLFRIQQATGIATLNADAFDLSGLTELQLGTIGAQLGATINEFSTDQEMLGDSNTAVPTENAVVGYTQRDNMGTGHLVPPTGTTAERPTGAELFTGGIRYNSSLVTWEGYNGTQWTGLGGGNPWQSTSSSITIAANDRYFVNTSSAAVTITLPASPQAGDQVSLIDLAGTFDTNNCTVARNGNKIMGLTENLVLSIEDAGITLVYSGATYGWKLANNI
jgi:hypothetical protein